MISMLCLVQLLLGLAIPTSTGVESAASRSLLANVESPTEFAQLLDKELQSGANFPISLVIAAERFLELLRINKRPQETCNSYSIKQIRDAINLFQQATHISAQDDKARELSQKINKMTKKVLFEHSGLCQPIYEKKFLTYDPNLRKLAKEFGEDFMYHLMSVDEIGMFCAAKTSTIGNFSPKNQKHLDSCAYESSSALLTMTEEMGKFVGPSIVYRMMLDYGRNDPEKDNLLESPKRISAFYKEYLMDPCRRFSVLGTHLFRPLDFDRIAQKNQRGVHVVNSGSIDFIYSWMAYSVCENFVLNPKAFENLKRVAEIEQRKLRAS